MGNIIESQYKKQQKTQTNIMSTIDNIMQNYFHYCDSDECSNVEPQDASEFCSNVAIFYYDRLTKLPNFKDASMGFIHDENNNEQINKQAMCAKIVNYYRRRIELLIKIKQIIKLAQNTFYSSKRGNLCLNASSIVINEEDCNGENMQWISEDAYKDVLLNSGNKKYIDLNRVAFIGRINEYTDVLRQIVKKIRDDMTYKENDEQFTNEKKDIDDTLTEILTYVNAQKYELMRLLRADK